MRIPRVIAHRGSSAAHPDNSWTAFEAAVAEGADAIEGYVQEARAPRPHRLVDAARIDRLRRAGLAITLWHEEREDELRALVAVEPDAICTNTPAVLRRIVDAHRASSAAVIEP